MSIPITALIIALIGLWAFALPSLYGTVALYGSFVIAALAAAYRSQSRPFEIAAIVLGILFVITNFSWLFSSVDHALSLKPIFTTLAAVYFLWQALRKGAQQKTFHLILAIFQLTTLAMLYLHLLANGLPATKGISSNFWFVLVLNRIFDAQLLLVIVAARFRIHATNNPIAWQHSLQSWKSWKLSDLLRFLS